MKKAFYDEWDEKNYEVDIPDELYEKAYSEHDCNALYEIGIILETESDISLAAIADIMEEAYADGKGSWDAYEWLKDYHSDDGRYDAWS